MGARRLDPESPLLRRYWEEPYRRPVLRPYRGIEIVAAISKVLTNTSTDSGSGGNLSVATPTSILSTDVAVMVCSIGNNTTSGSYTTPTGWTKVGEVINANTGSNHITLQVFWALGSVATPTTFTLSGASASKGYICVAFRGVDATTPIDATGTANSGTGASSLTANAVTIATNNAWELIGTADWLSGNLTSTGFTAAQNGTTNETACLLYNTTPLSTGSTGTKSVASSAGTSGQVIAAVPFALRPIVSSSGRISRASGLEGLGGVGQQAFNPSLGM